jgi:hypothetical protein
MIDGWTRVAIKICVQKDFEIDFDRMVSSVKKEESMNTTLQKDAAFVSEDIGKVGVDDRGMRFVVIDASNITGSRVYAGEIHYIVVLPGGRNGIPGTCLHFSWVDHPVTWEED